MGLVHESGTEGRWTFYLFVGAGHTRALLVSGGVSGFRGNISYTHKPDVTRNTRYHVSESNSYLNTVSTDASAVYSTSSSDISTTTINGVHVFVYLLLTLLFNKSLLLSEGSPE